jgi:hypothetical protein
MWKNTVDPDRHRLQYGACALHAGYLMLQMHTLKTCNTHCFSTERMVARMRLVVTLYIQHIVSLVMSLIQRTGL